MNVGIIGYGRMGHLIRREAQKKGFSVTTVVDPFCNEPEVTHNTLTEEALAGVDVVIDFSLPQSTLENIAICAKCGVGIVVGTTGWYSDREQAKELVLKAESGCIWSGNFSLGVQLFFLIVESAGAIMNSFDAYDCMVHEFHHNQKADSPSGTAVMIGDRLLKTLERKKRIVSEALDRRIEPDELHISSTRGGSIPGIHSVLFDSEVDTVELTHSARSRDGFAVGAVRAAEWLYQKKGFFSIEDMMQDIIGL